MTKEELYELNLKEIKAAEEAMPTEEEIKQVALRDLDRLRGIDLEGFVIDNVFMNEELIKTMMAQHTFTPDGENIEWIGDDNSILVFTKEDFGLLIKQGISNIKDIYFKYRKAKDGVINPELNPLREYIPEPEVQ